jgi:mRNA-degrading endonuclease toxin of MazEF toxin-antitoxin module
MVKIETSAENQLSRDSAANVLQAHSISTKRLVKCLGQVYGKISQGLLAG